MLLYQSTLSPWNTTFRNAEGQVIYKTETHSSIARQITIKHILPSNTSSIDLAIASEDPLRDSFSDLAEIHFGLLSSRIHLSSSGGQIFCQGENCNS